jgi:hypothetical protein
MRGHDRADMQIRQAIPDCKYLFESCISTQGSYGSLSAYVKPLVHGALGELVSALGGRPHEAARLALYTGRPQRPNRICHRAYGREVLRLNNFEFRAGLNQICLVFDGRVPDRIVSDEHGALLQQAQ